MCIKGLSADHDSQINHLNLTLIWIWNFFMGSILWLYQTQGWIIICAPLTDVTRYYSKREQALAGYIYKKEKKSCFAINYLSFNLVYVHIALSSYNILELGITSFVLLFCFQWTAAFTSPHQIICLKTPGAIEYVDCIYTERRGLPRWYNG